MIKIRYSNINTGFGLEENFVEVTGATYDEKEAIKKCGLHIGGFGGTAFGEAGFHLDKVKEWAAKNNKQVKFESYRHK